MSIFYHNDDPLLSQPRFFSSTCNDNSNNNSQIQQINQLSEMYKQQLLQEMQKNSNNNNVMQKDWLGELDARMKSLDGESVRELNGNEEFARLNNELQTEIQKEIISLVKYKLNSSNIVLNNAQRQMEIIDSVTNKIKDEERKNMLELNEYVKNYSHLTFDEYKRIKNGGNTNNNNTKKQKK